LKGRYQKNKYYRLPVRPSQYGRRCYSVGTVLSPERPVFMRHPRGHANHIDVSAPQIVDEYPVRRRAVPAAEKTD